MNDPRKLLTKQQREFLASYRYAAIEIHVVGLESSQWNARPLMRSPNRVWQGQTGKPS